MMKHIKSILTLFCICAIVSVALAVCYGITYPIIKAREDAAASGALLEVMPDGGTFELVDLSSYENVPATVKEAYKASNGGYVLKLEYNGYASGNVAMVGVSADGKVTGTKLITIADKGGKDGKDSAAELPIMDANGHFVGADIGTIDGVDTVAGITTSSKFYRAAVKDALAAATILGGGSYRTPEEILSDNLNAALGLEGAEFEKYFMIVELTGVDAIYVEKNGAGHVVVIGDKYIGVGADGNVVAGVDAETNEITVGDEDKATAEGAIVAIKSVVTTTINIADFSGVSKRVKSAEVTDKGVYILKVEGAGFGKNGDSHSHPSGEYLVIRIAITADGKILDCYTEYLNESSLNNGNYGDVAAYEEFYGQFAGKDQSNYNTVIISGATYTTNGYHTAIKNAYKAINIFQGGAN